MFGRRGAVLPHPLWIEEAHVKQSIKKHLAVVGVSWGLRDYEKHWGCASLVVKALVVSGPECPVSRWRMTLCCSTGIVWPVGQVASGRWWRMSSITNFSVPATFAERLHWDVHHHFQEVVCKFTHSCCMDENCSEKVEILLPWCFFRICVRAFWF